MTGLIVGFCIILAFALGCVPFMYSYYIYNKNRIFGKTKYSTFGITISGVMIAISLVAGLLLIAARNKMDFSATPFIALSFVLMAIAIAYLVLFIVIVKITNKDKIALANIHKPNYSQLLKQTKQQIVDVEQFKKMLMEKNPKQFSLMLNYYKTALTHMNNKQLSEADKLAYIVTFNDAFSNKWSSKKNLYVAYLTYEFLDLFEKNRAKK